MCSKAGTGRLTKLYTKYTKTKMYTLRFMSSKIRFKYLFCSPYQNYCDLPSIIVSGGHLQSPPRNRAGQCSGGGSDGEGQDLHPQGFKSWIRFNNCPNFWESYELVIVIGAYSRILCSSYNNAGSPVCSIFTPQTALPDSA